VQQRSITVLSPDADRCCQQDYVSCWQQGLPNGQTDASVCDIGTSRWFNYYLWAKSALLVLFKVSG